MGSTTSIKDYVFYSDHNGGIGSSKVLPIKPDNSRINEYLDRPRLIRLDMIRIFILHF